MSDEVSETVNEKSEIDGSRRTDHEPAPKVKPQREKDPKKVAAGKKLAEKTDKQKPL